MGDTLGFVSLYSHAWEWTISTNRLMTVRASSAHGTAKKKKKWLRHIGAPTRTLSHQSPLPPSSLLQIASPRSSSSALSPFLFFFFSYVVSWSSLSSLRRAGPPRFRSKVICAMDANVLYDLKERLFTTGSYPASSPPVRPRLAASGRPVGLLTTLTFLSTTMSTLTTVDMQLAINNSNPSLDNSFDCDGHRRSVASTTLRVSRPDSPVVFHCPSFFVCCCSSRLSWLRCAKVPAW